MALLAVHMIAVANGPNPVKGDKNTVYARCGLRVPRHPAERLPAHLTAASGAVTCRLCAQPAKGWRDLGLPL